MSALIDVALLFSLVAAPDCCRPPEIYDAADADIKNMNALLIQESDLIDPFSAEFRNVKAHSESTLEEPPLTTLKIYCGEINAKNRMGGYVGWRRFAITSTEAKDDPNADSALVSIDSGSAADGIFVDTMCKWYGREN